MRALLVGLMSLGLLVLWGCGGGNKGAVEKAIRTHLEKNSSLALNAFTTEISDVKFEGDNAQAKVKFKSKQNPAMSVDVQYALHKEGGQWVVQSSNSTGMGGNPHGGAMPPGAMGTNPHGGSGVGGNPHEGVQMPPADSSSPPAPAPSH